MEEQFDYENIFMGVMEKKKTNYLRTFADDYRIKRLTELLKLKSGRILDIGCGGGITTESLPYYYQNLDYFGCDVSKSAIEYAKKRGSGKVRYAVIRGKKLPYKDNYFDACICLDVMEHIPDVEFFLNEVKRILKKDGQFFLLLPCEGQPFTFTWLFQKIRIGSRLTFSRYGHIHPEFTHRYVENLLKKHGFTIKDKMYSEHLLYQIFSVFLYFLPTELLRIFLGKKADQYSDSGVIRHKKNKKKGFDPILLLRNFWLSLTRVTRNITAWELDTFKRSPVTAWKLIVLAKKK
jgi:SAM-dependent methyltransferase